MTVRFPFLRIVGLAVLVASATSPADADVTAALASADPARGARVFAQCAACHTVEQGARHKVGPNLHGTVGGPVAAADGFAYSSALTAYGGEWTVARLDAFLARPRAEVRGTKMAFAGLRSAEDRVNLIAYLSTFSPDSTPLAAVPAATSDAGAGSDADGAYAFGVLFDAPGVEATYYACTACHSERIVAQQGFTRTGWDKLFVWMVEEQGMAEIYEPDRSEILDYLAAHYNEDRPNFPRPIGN